MKGTQMKSIIQSTIIVGAITISNFAMAGGQISKEIQQKRETQCRKVAAQVKSELTGVVLTKEIQEQIRLASAGLTVRIHSTLMPITADFSPSRLTVSIDKDNKIVSASCF